MRHLYSPEEDLHKKHTYTRTDCNVSCQLAEKSSHRCIKVSTQPPKLLERSEQLILEDSSTPQISSQSKIARPRSPPHKKSIKLIITTNLFFPPYKQSLPSETPTFPQSESIPIPPSSLDTVLIKYPLDISTHTRRKTAFSSLNHLILNPNKISNMYAV